LWIVANEIKGSRIVIFLIDKYGGEIPTSFEAFRELPAVGHKTASVDIDEHGVPGFFCRYHIHRLMYRWNLTWQNGYKQKGC
jgi:endonuclease III